MQFVTRKGVTSQDFAGNYIINEYRVLCIGDNQEHLVGFFGAYGHTFDSVGFNKIKEVMQK